MQLLKGDVIRYDLFSNYIDYHGYRDGDEDYEAISDVLVDGYKRAFEKVSSDLNGMLDFLEKNPDRRGPDGNFRIADVVKLQQMKSTLDSINDELVNLQQNKMEVIAKGLGKEYQRGWFQTGHEAFQQFGDQYDSSGLSLFQMNPDRCRRAILNPVNKMKVDERLGRQAREVQREVSSVIANGIIAGKSYADMAKGISKALNSDFNRAMRVARTEGHRVQNEAKQDMMDRLTKVGVNYQKQWISSMDEQVRRSHALMNGQIAKAEGEIPPELENKREELEKQRVENIAKWKKAEEAKKKAQEEEEAKKKAEEKPEAFEEGKTLNDIPSEFLFSEEKLKSYARRTGIGFDYDEENMRFTYDREFVPIEERPHKLWNPVLKPKNNWDHMLSPWAKQAGLTSEYINEVNKAQSEALMKPEVTVGVRRGMRGAKGFFKDLRMKTQFETNRSSGFIGKSGERTTARAEAEMRMFGYDVDMPSEQRPVYGYVQRKTDTEKINTNAGQYGPVKFVMKQGTKGRTTVTASDSLFAKDYNHSPSAMNDFRVESIVNHNRWEKTAPSKSAYARPDSRNQWDDEILNTYSYKSEEIPISDADKAKLGVRPDARGYERKLLQPQEIRENPFTMIDKTPYYVEAQIHGGCTVDDVEEVIFFDQKEIANKDGEFVPVTQEENDKNAKTIEKECKKTGIPFRRVIGWDNQGNPVYYG